MVNWRNKESDKERERERKRERERERERDKTHVPPPNVRYGNLSHTIGWIEKEKITQSNRRREDKDVHRKEKSETYRSIEISFNTNL